ncbi:unnamed protein product [Brassica rapa]|nr:unnamed protein product [Brassica rapa]
MSLISWIVRHKTSQSLTSPKRSITMNIKRRNTQQTKIVISIDMKTTSSGYLTHETASNMEFMLGYHEIDFDTITEIIEEASAVAARNIPTLNNPTNIDFDIIVKINDLNPDAIRRIDLDVYLIELRDNRRDTIPSERNDICPICWEEFGTELDINSLSCYHTYHHHCISNWVEKTLTCPYCRAVLA